MKKVEKTRAIELRRKGWSVGVIALELGVSKSSVSLWVRDLQLPKSARLRIQASLTNGQNAARIVKKARTSSLLTQARGEAERAAEAYDTDPLTALIFCALLYWCEGSKSLNDKELTFSNSDPLLIGAYLSLLRRAFLLDESRLRVLLHLHEYHDEKAQLKYWSRITGIPTGQFLKSYLKPHTGKRTRPNYPGCAQIRYYDVRVARKVYATARAVLSKESSMQGP